MKIKLTQTLIMVIGIIMAGCNATGERKVEKARIKAEKANQEYLEEMENYKIEKLKIIKENESAINECKALSDNKEKNAFFDYHERLSDLERRNQIMKEKLKEYEHTGGEEWISFQEEFNEDLSELGKSVEDLVEDGEQ